MDAIALVATKLVPIAFAGGAVYLAAHNMAGWGWCILGAILTFTYECSCACEEDETEPRK